MLRRSQSCSRSLGFQLYGLSFFSNSLHVKFECHWSMCSPRTKPERGSVRTFPRNENRNGGTFAKTTLFTKPAFYLPVEFLSGVRKYGVRNRCPYRRCGVDTKIPYRLPFWKEFCRVLQVRVVSRDDTEFAYRVRIVDRGVDCRDPVCRHRFRFPEINSKRAPN